MLPTWTVRFSPWWIFVGCAIAGVGSLIAPAAGIGAAAARWAISSQTKI